MSIDLLGLEKELIEMPEYKRLQNIERFSQSLKLFDANASEFINHLNQTTETSTVLEKWALDNQAEFSQFQSETLRLFHNFVASAFTLVDHARNFHKDNYKEKGIFLDYETEVKLQFLDDPFCQFVQDLRNYFIHKELPIIVNTLSLSNSGMQESMFVQKSILSDSYNWKAKSKEYLDASPENIVLLDIANAYSEKIHQFYQWFFRRLEEIHKEDIDKVTAKKQQLKEQLQKEAIMRNVPEGVINLILNQSSKKS